MGRTTVLIVEDEPAIADLLAYGLNREGYDTWIAGTAADGMLLLERHRPDLLLLDWMLPDGNGLDICKRVTAAYSLPIIMLTAKSDITDKILGLEFGADDYITKPFDLREVIARIRTALRRVGRKGIDVAHADKPPIVRFGDLEIAVDERTVRNAGQAIELTPKEFDLLITLFNHKGKIFTRAELLDFVWGYDFAGDTRTVDTHVQRLRKKLDGSSFITTVFGIGYKFEKQAPPS